MLLSKFSVVYKKDLMYRTEQKKETASVSEGIAQSTTSDSATRGQMFGEKNLSFGNWQWELKDRSVYTKAVARTSQNSVYN